MTSGGANVPFPARAGCVSLPGRRAVERPDLATLRALHAAHAYAIPFENLDVQLGRAIRIDLPSVFAKLVTGGRGGYCFEQNHLFAAALGAFGFSLTTLAARVRWGTPGVRARTHMVLAVDLPEGRFLADVGFGGLGLTGPLGLDTAAPQALPVDSYRFTREANYRVLEALVGDEWTALYAFTDEEHFHCDYEMANHFTSSHPASRFVQNVIAARPLKPSAESPAGGRVTLLNRELTIRWAGKVDRGELDDRGVAHALRKHFELTVDDGVKLRALV
jgi:N-hydroxyarylamine O-acetyltransferase